MNGAQINNFLSLDPFTGSVYRGLAMQDSNFLPGVSQNRALYVLNTDKSRGEGEHWCAVYFENSIQEFWDPFGLPPEAYEFERLLSLRKGVKSKVCNGQQVQDFSNTTCGPHCLFFAFHRCRGYSMQAILKLYSQTNFTENDRMVDEFVTGFGSSYKLKKFFS